MRSALFASSTSNANRPIAPFLWSFMAGLRTSAACPRSYDKITVSAPPREVVLMPFEKVETQVDFPARERAVLEFWQRSGTFEQLRKKNAGKPKWSFLDGPITANNPMGVHHAWGRTYTADY